jgi:hypothetical protein
VISYGRARILAAVFKKGSITHCNLRPWVDNDLTYCLYRYLKTAFPLAYIGISILVLLLTYTYPLLRRHFHNYKLRSNPPQLLSTTDDESSDSEEVTEDTDSDTDGDASEATESTLVESLPHNTKVAVIYDKPRFSLIRIIGEIVLLLGEVALSIVTIIKSEGWRSIAVVGHIQWVYLLIIAGLRLLGTKRTWSLWTHSTLIYMFSWPIAFILLRSAVMDHRYLDRDFQIANIAFISALCTITLTGRPGNKSVRLVSTNGHQPTTVLTLRSQLIIGTRRLLDVARLLQLGRSSHYKRMGTPIHRLGRLGS